MKKIRILLIEDNRLLRDGIAAILKKQPDIHVAESAGNGENILELIEKHKPDIVLIDLGLQNQNSLRVVKLIKKKFQLIKIIVMDLVPLQTDVFKLVQAGVSGFMLKNIKAADFLKTIRSVYEGAQVLPSHLTGSLFTQVVENAINSTDHSTIFKSIRMTKREKEVIELIADGLTNKEIAQELHISSYTVKSHVHNILEKLAIHTRVQIAKHAYISNPNNLDDDNTPLTDK